jgi:hypothetical protein
LDNCKEKGRKGRHFSQQKGKIRKNFRVGIFIKQHMSGLRDVVQFISLYRQEGLKKEQTAKESKSRD